MNEPLFTAKMLAETLNVPVGAVRLWRRRGLLCPARTVGRLDYFDRIQFQNAKIFAKLYHAGLRPARVADKIELLRMHLPDTGKSLMELPIEIDGCDVLIRRNGFLQDAAGQLLFPFEESATTSAEARTVEVVRLGHNGASVIETGDGDHGERVRLLETAWDREDDGDLSGALEAYRAVLMKFGPDATLCFQIAELLYRRGDLGGCRERYCMTLELDADFVEARANLACVLVELGDLATAIREFEETLRHHPDYADVHFHLARALEKLGQPQRAAYHRRLYEELAPGDPWSDH